jgi:acyl carrier protein
MSDDKLAGCLAAVDEVFGGSVDADQGFYDLGGNSLHAIQLTVRVRELTGIEVNAYDMVSAESLAKFFRHTVDNG